jgi:hypothetical protein
LGNDDEDGLVPSHARQSVRLGNIANLAPAWVRLTAWQRVGEGRGPEALTRRLFRTVRTVRVEADWINLLDDGTLLSRYEDKSEAVRAGREAAERLGVEHVVHNEEGSVAGRNDYGWTQEANDC